MAEETVEHFLEKALLAVLPLFAFNVSSSTPTDISSAGIDNRTRKSQTFDANFLAEAQTLTTILENVVGSRCKTEKWWATRSDEYVENLGKVLHLFDNLVSDEVPGRTLNGNFKLCDQEYLNLYALYQLLPKDCDSRSFAECELFILLAKREKKHDKILAKISKYNRRLSRLIDHRNATAKERVDEEASGSISLYEATGSTSSLYGTREKMHKLYETLTASWRKSCQSPHEAKLRLATFRPVESVESKSKKALGTARNFDLLFFTHGYPTQCKQSRIEVPDDEMVKSRVKLPNPIAGENLLNKQTIQFYASVCKVFEESGRDKSFLHFRAADEGLWKLPPNFKLDYLQVSETLPTVSLKTLIASAAKFSLRQRRVIAVILAYSLLYLSQSALLEREWTKEDICFLQNAEGKVDIGRPYFSINFPGPDCQGDELHNNDSRLCYHPAPSLLGFGILLIELEFGKPIESLWTNEDLTDGKKNPNTNRTAAKRFLETATQWNDDVYVRFRSAVSACISGIFLDFEETDDDPRHLNFQKAIYENVVNKLEQELCFGFQLKADSLDDSPYSPCFEYQGTSVIKNSAIPVRPKEKLSLNMTSRPVLPRLEIPEVRRL